MKKVIIFCTVFLISTFLVSSNLFAQCAMCAINAEQGTKNGNTQGVGLNTGIIYLLVIPYILAVVIGVIWYKKYRKPNILT
ncbi:hypothetical protein EZJ43_02740 [Pedobacter changchengzhani]|uniref:Uncharacterized protein n=1 Tax=Pedobacter changchengzhani TaxID=2529274 RepID=A0A4R5MQN1_9SPHI|nr:hypothetical protein EZJ43_02740 [Pedobacter changchengzhani]